MASIKKNFFYSGILTTANYIFPFITYPYVSRVLGVTNIGICNFVDSIINYFILFSMMGISIVGIREIAKSKNDPAQLNRTFSSLFWINTISTSFVLIVLCISIYTIPQLYVYKELLFIGVFKLAFNYLNVDWLYKGLENFKYITVRTLVVKCLYVICVYALVHDKNDYIIYYVLLCGMTIVNAIINIIYSKHFVRITCKALTFKPFIKPFLTLGLYTFLTSMYTSFNVAYLGFTSGETEVGYYTTATKLYTILLAIFTAFTGVLLPRMSSLIAERKMDGFRELLKKSVDILFAFAIPTIIFAIIMAPEIIEIISGKGYEGAIVPMRIVMPLILVIGYEQILVIQTLMPLKEDKIILRNSILGAASGLLMNILLVSNWHSVGSAFVWVISELVVLTSAQAFLSKHHDIHFPIRRLLKSIIWHIPLLACVWLITLINNNPFITMTIAAIALLAYCTILQVFILKNEMLVSLYNKYIASHILKSKRP